jgi:2-polyprenyl-3-methyl-5-hydroxy-6-metoxy-1,4-benzoquinol methylase
MDALVEACAAAPGIVLFPPSIGWNVHLFQRPHHLARAFAARGFRVIFDCSNSNVDQVEFLREVEPGIHLFKGEPSVFSNLAGLILWTFTYNYDYVDHFPAATQVVYDWIDDLAVFPYDQAWLKQMHERAVRESDVVASVARRLHEDLRAQRPDAVYLPNAVDAAHFRTPPEPNPARLDADLADFVGSGAPVAGYYGALAEWFDYHLLAEVARLKPEWRFILVGPDYDQSLGRSRVTALENVRWIGPRDYAHLPGYLHLFDVAMIPFKINDITIATSPLKLFEYFAGGRPVVTTPMPECMAFSEVLIGATPADFAEHLDRALVSGKDEGKSVALRILGEQNTWDQRVEAVATALAKARQSGASQYGVAKQFKSLERADNRHFFRALARHFTNLAADPRLPGLLEYALTTNQRGRELCALVGKHVALAGKRYIDIDSAYGGTLVAFGEKGAKPMGIEADSQLIELAGQNFKDVGQAYPVYKRDFRRAEDLTEFQGQFDLITCQRAVVTIEDPRQAIGRVVDMLAPGGVAYIELPNYEAIDAVRADPKYGLFGATLLDATSVRAYLAAKSLPVSAEQTVYPTRAELMAWVAQAGLPSEVLTDTPPWFGWAGLAEQAAGLAHDGAAAIAQVPEEVRALVATALENYLSRLNGVINDTKRDPAALFAWGAPFLRVLIKKPSTSSVPQSQAPGVAANDGRPAYFQGWRHTKGRCNICGHDTRFFYQDPALYRESLTCEHCRSTSRYRSIARGVLRALKDIAGVEAPSLAALPTTGVGHKVRIYDTQVPFAYEVCAYPLGKYLRACDWIELNLSMYKPDKPLGARLAEGIGNQNLEALTFADASMDIVITSDVMEHVRVDDAAHREIARVLAPGGAYVFTVPHIMALAETRQLVRIHDPRDASKDEFLCEPEYHGDANSDDGKGVLAYRCYGGDLRDILESKGFAWDYTFEAYPEIGIENTELFYCRRQPLTAHKVESKQDVLGAQRIDDEGASVEPIEVETVTSRFKAMRNPSNRFFFDALSRHLAGLVDDPCLPMYFSFALTANERGEKVANLLGQRMEIRGKRHLDVGCAFGGFLVAFHEQGASTCGFDIDASLLSLARANFRDESVEHALYLKDVTKAEDVAEFKACFDIVTCNDVIEHVADPAAAFANIAAMLSANGVAYFEIPNRDAAAFVLADGHYQLFGISQLDRDDARAYYAAHAPGVPYGVEHYYRLAQYRNLLDQCGMDMEILEESLEGVTRENTEQALRTIDASLRQEMKKVPNTVADQVDAAVRDYLHRAKDSSQDSCMKEREFLLTYGAGFWKILARKR